MTRRRLALLSSLVATLMAGALASAPAFAQSGVSIPITIDAPSAVAGVHSWPVSAGIPFPPGLIGGFEDYTIVDDRNRAVPCQIDEVAHWPDGTVRWARADFIADPARAYRLTTGARAAFVPITLQLTSSGLQVTTGPARYFFPAGAATFDRVELDINGDRVFQSGETIVSGARDAFHVIDSAGQYVVLHNGVLSVERAGPLHTIVRTEGNYLAGSARRAAATIYFHFYAGLAQVRVSHRLIITEDTESLWLFQSGLSLPLATSGNVEASFNSDRDDPLRFAATTVRNGDEAMMSQLEFPHHDRDASSFSVELRTGSSSHLLQSGTASGDWADIFDQRIGLTAQVPAFAEQAPKAFRITPTTLTIELWSDYGGLELDFRKSTVYPANFDTWFNAFAGDTDWARTHSGQVTHGNSTLPSNGTGSAKVHDIWLYPHAGEVQPATLGATRQEIVARADPAWIAASGAFGPIHPYDPVRFNDTEKAIDDYYTRSIFISQRIFPQTGYFFYGQYPFVAQPWDFRNGRWYPEWNRLSRQMDYNLRRSVWILWARGGDRKYYDFARRNTRFLGDFIFSNFNVSYKPLGWSVQGLWHSAIPWGQYGRGTPSYSSDSGASLASASSEDVIQFVYDYFLNGDLHSRDVARNWKQAMLTVMQPGVDLNEAVLRTIDYDTNGAHPQAFELPYLFLRLVGSIYELDHDPLVYDFGHAVLEKLADAGATDNILNPEYRTNFSKQLEAISAYYYYWISTADPTAKTVLLRYADFAYRFGRIDGFFSRHNGAVPFAFAVAWQERHDPAVVAYLAQAVREYGRDALTLDDENLNESSFRATQEIPSWKPQVLDEQAVVGIGLPLAMAATAEAMAGGIALPEVPYVDKPVAVQPAYLVFDKGAGAARIDLYVNDIGGRDFHAILKDQLGNPVTTPLIVLAEKDHWESEPPAGVRLSDRQWYGMTESQMFRSLEIPSTVPAGMYSLELGRDVAMRVLYTNLTLIQQVAPDGIVVSPGSALYFSIPETTPPGAPTTVELFSYRGFRIFDRDGFEVDKEQVNAPLYGNFRFEASESDYSIEPGPDPYFAPGVTSGETFVRFSSIPAIVASGDRTRLFHVEEDDFPSLLPSGVLPTTMGGHQYGTGPFGGPGIVLDRSVVEAPAPAGFPFTEGTIEFWMKPYWSSTDYAIDRPSGSDTLPMAKRVELFSMPPFNLTYWLNPDNSGVTSRHVVSQLKLQISGVDGGNAGNAVLKYPTRLYFQKGRWYHIAITWRINGVNSDIALFVNGHEKSFEVIDEELGPVRTELSYAGGIPVPGGPIRFGAGKPCTSSHCAPPGAQFDELRISNTWRTSFPLPAGPFSPDANTYLLMHFDNVLDVAVGSTTASVVSDP